VGGRGGVYATPSASSRHHGVHRTTTVAPLREPSRLQDIRALVAHYLAKYQCQLGKRIMGLTPDAFRALVHYSWPGNVRQLSNVCLCLVTHAPTGSLVDIGDIRRLRPEVVSGPRNPHPEACLEDETVGYADAIRLFRRRLVVDRLRRHGGRAADAALSLGISEPTFYRYLADARRMT
jgi:transcriptional regulator with PAS, ATPase and Fis domain